MKALWDHMRAEVLRYLHFQSEHEIKTAVMNWPATWASLSSRDRGVRALMLFGFVIWIVTGVRAVSVWRITILNLWLNQIRW